MNERIQSGGSFARKCRGRAAAVFVASGGAWAAGGAARAADPLNSSVKAAAHPEESDEGHNEGNVLPVVGGTTDIGYGGGYFAGLARVRNGYDPYEWNLESEGLVTFKFQDGGHLVLPYQDVSLALTVPRFLGAPIRLVVRPSYTWESTLNYYGIGNASSAAVPPGSATSYHEYQRIHPELSIDLWGLIADHLAWRVGIHGTETWVRVNSNSRLAEDLRGGSSTVKSILGSTQPNTVVAFTYGLQFDTRDNDVATHEGTYESADVRLSPGGVEPFHYRYGRAMLVGRVFVPIWKPRITLAVRVVGDWLFGDPPFYELARFDTTYALGGQNGVRGIPAERYYGKLKAFGNVELRTEIASFHALGKALVFGAVAFLDGGRVWTDVTPHPELDGTGIGLKYGVGGGLRLRSGSSFVLRADVAWSPDATPIGAYFAAGEMF